MSSYCITFRIANKTVNGKTYDQRREALVAAVRTEGMGYWDETTSFFLVESNLDTRSMGQRASAPLSVNDDMVSVFDPDDMSLAYFGAVDSPEVLTSFFRTAKKLP